MDSVETRTPFTDDQVRVGWVCKEHGGHATSCAPECYLARDLLDARTLDIYRVRDMDILREARDLAERQNNLLHEIQGRVIDHLNGCGECADCFKECCVVWADHQFTALPEK